MDSKKIIGAVVVVIVLAAAGFMVLKPKSVPMSQKESTPIVSDQETNSPSNENGSSDSAMSSDVKEFTITGSSFKFDQTSLKVKKGDTVKITFKNAGGMHDFVIDEFNARTKIIKEGEVETIEFVANNAGSFEYYCSVGNHKALGMVGTLIVE